MAYDTTTTVVDDVDDNLASYHNQLKTAIDKVMSSVAYANYGTTTASSGTVTLTDSSFPVQAITPGTANVVLRLPAVGTTNHPFFVINTGTAYTVQVQNAGSTNIGSAIGTATYAPYVSSGTAWYSLGASSVKATGAELDTGTDDAKFATAKALKDSHNVPSVAPGTSGNVMTSDGTIWTSAAAATGAGVLDVQIFS